MSLLHLSIDSTCPSLFLYLYLALSSQEHLVILLLPVAPLQSSDDEGDSLLIRIFLGQERVESALQNPRQLGHIETILGESELDVLSDPGDEGTGYHLSQQGGTHQMAVGTLQHLNLDALGLSEGGHVVEHRYLLVRGDIQVCLGQSVSGQRVLFH